MGRLIRALAARAAQAALVALTVGLACFLLVETLPGDFAFRIAAGRYGEDLVGAEAAAAVRLELGLDRPWDARLLDWLGRLAMFDLGRSMVSGEPVVEELAHQLGASVQLALAALAASLLLGPPLGALAAAKAGSALDHAVLAGAALLRAAPAFIVGVGLMLVLAVWARLLPAAGYDTAAAWVLPTLTLALGLAATSSRVARAATLEALRAPWLAFAETKGLSRPQAMRRHVARNAAAPVAAYLGVQLAHLVEGVVVVEALFAWPGIGHALVHAVIARDVPMIQGTALTMGLMFVVLTAAADALCLALDPRAGRRT